jgi:hypothetical protein
MSNIIPVDFQKMSRIPGEYKQPTQPDPLNHLANELYRVRGENEHLRILNSKLITKVDRLEEEVKALSECIDPGEKT